MDNCFCIKGVPGLDFYVKSLDTSTIVFNNLSEWVTDEPYTIPETHHINLTFPDSSVVTVEVNSQSSTIIKASDIGFNRYKDGIYCFKIDGLDENSGGCGIDYTKVAGIFPNIECCLNQAYSTLDDQFFDEIKKAESWLDRAKRSASLKMESQALEEWKTAKRLLQKLNCECNC